MNFNDEYKEQEMMRLEGLHYHLLTRNYSKLVNLEVDDINYNLEVDPQLSEVEKQQIEKLEKKYKKSQKMIMTNLQKKDGDNENDEDDKQSNEKIEEELEEVEQENNLSLQQIDQQKQPLMQKQLAIIPKKFIDTEDYINTFEQHIFIEAQAQIQKAIALEGQKPEPTKLEGVEKMKNFRIGSSNPAGQFWKFRLSRTAADIEKGKNSVGAGNDYSQHDFCLLSSVDPTAFNNSVILNNKNIKNNKNQKNEIQFTEQHFLGIIESVDGNQVQVKVVYNENQENNKIRQSWYLMKLCRIVTIEREYEALQAIYEASNSTGNILQAILNPEGNLKENGGGPKKQIQKKKNNQDEYFSIPNNLEDKLLKNYNESQLEAIQQTLKKSGITLIQGPPGTGKTTTVIGTVSVLMNSFNKVRKNSAEEGLKRQGMKNDIFGQKIAFDQQKAMPWMYSGFQDWRDGIFTENDEIDIQTENLQFVVPKLYEKIKGMQVPKRVSIQSAPPEKILICGPSNASIDEIMRKLIEKKLLDAEGLSYDPSSIIVRIGENYDESLQPFSLDWKVTQLMQEKNMKEGQKEEAKKLVLKQSKIVCGTLSATGSMILQSGKYHFDTVIIDEAAQAVEVSTLIPLQYGCKRLILIGDQKQLPATIFSKICEDFNYSQSLFERMEKNGHPIHMLKMQYRMHPRISSFISQSFYEGNLRDFERISELVQLPKHDFYEQRILNKSLAFFQVDGAESFVDSSYKNSFEAAAIVRIYQELKGQIKMLDLKKSLGIITPYQKQVKEIRKLIKAIDETQKCEIEVNSVDGYQGREKDIIIFSTVRASKIAKESILKGVAGEPKIVKNPRKTIGFLNDARRMNVSLSRARIALIVVGDMNQLKHHEKWKLLIEHCLQNEACYHVNSEFLSEDNDEKHNNYFDQLVNNEEKFKITKLVVEKSKKKNKNNNVKAENVQEDNQDEIEIEN